MSFPARLKELRENAGIKQEELAERSGVPKGTIRNLEQGRRKPNLETAQKLAVALGVDCTAFLEEPTTEVVKSPGRPRRKK